MFHMISGFPSARKITQKAVTVSPEWERGRARMQGRGDWKNIGQKKGTLLLKLWVVQSFLSIWNMSCFLTFSSKGKVGVILEEWEKKRVEGCLCQRNCESQVTLSQTKAPGYNASPFLCANWRQGRFFFSSGRRSSGEEVWLWPQRHRFDGPETLRWPRAQFFSQRPLTDLI